MILSKEDPVRPASPQAAWSRPFIYPERYIPFMGAMIGYFEDGDYEEANRNMIFTLRSFLAVEKRFQAHPEGVPFDVEAEMQKTIHEKSDSDAALTASAYAAYINVGWKLLNMETKCAYAEPSFLARAREERAFQKTGQDALIHIPGIKFTDGSDVECVNIHWMTDEPDSAGVEVVFLGRPSRWPTPMRVAVAMGDIRSLFKMPLKAIDAYELYMQRQGHAKDNPSYEFSLQNLRHLADKIPLYLAAFDEMKNSLEMDLDLTLPELVHNPSIGQQHGVETMKARAYAELMSSRLATKYNISPQNKPVWIIR